MSKRGGGGGGGLSIFRRVDDVTRAMSKGAGLVNVFKAEGDDVTWAMSKGVLVNVFTPPPLQEILYPCLGTISTWHYMHNSE